MDASSQARRDFSRIGIALFLMFLLTYGLVQLLAMAAARIFGESVVQMTWVTLLISAGVQYLIAMPAAFLIIRGLPKQDIAPLKITFGRFMILFLICYFLMYAGNLLGLGANAIIAHFTDSTMDFYIKDMLTGSNIYIYALFVVILAPVIEELFFRKLLITRIERFGEAPAIIVSGLVFGLFHGNLYQVFYAIALGMALGYIYIRTRKILVTIGLHIIINLFGGVLTPLAAASHLVLAALAGFAALGVMISGFVMFIIRIRKVSLIQRPGQLPAPGWGQYAFANFGMILFFAGSTAVFVLNTLGMLVPN